MNDLKKRLPNFFNSVLPIFAILITVSIFFWKVFLKKQVPFPGDFVVGIYYPWLDYKWGYPTGVPVKNPIVADVPSFIYPMQTFAVDLMKSGKFPLWNPHILAGVPLLANFQSAPFAPTVLFYFIFNKVSAWTIQIIISHILAAIFTYLLLRWWKVSKLASVWGGIIFAFSGYNLIWSQWNGHTLAAAFIPLILFFEDRWIKKFRIIDGLGLSLSFCLQIFSGYPQTVIYTAVVCGLLWFINILGSNKAFLKTLGLSFFFFLGFGLAAPQILTGKELLSLSQWMSEPHPLSWAFLPWKKIITFIAPDYFGNHVTQNYWGPQDYTSNTGFVGVVAFMFSILGAMLIKKRKEISFSISLLITTLLFSFPTFLSIFLWQKNLFGMKSSSAHRALVLFNLSVAILSAFGFDYLKLKPRKRQFLISIICPILIFIFFGIYALTLKSIMINNVSVSLVALRNLIFPFGILILTVLIICKKNKFSYLLIVLSIVEIFRFGWKFTPFTSTNLVFPTTPVLQFLASQTKPFRITANKVIPVNLSMAYGLESLEGYETMRPFWISQFLASMNKKSSSASPAGRYGIVDNDTSELLDLVNTKYYLSLKNDTKRFNSERFYPVFSDKSVVVYESRSVLPRAFMVFDWEVEDDNKKILDKLLDPKFPFTQKIILSKNTATDTVPINRNISSKVDYLKYDYDRSVIQVSTGESGLLFISDAFYPGWKAYVDGQEKEIIRADFAFRAVEIPRGNHKVVFIYKPTSFFNGLKIGIISFTMAVVLTVGIVLNKLRLTHYTQASKK
jgi:hypothetical protein